MFRSFLLILTVALLPIAAIACNGDDDDGDDFVPLSSPVRDSTAAAEPTSSAASPSASRTQQAERVLDRDDGEPWTEQDAALLLDAALLEPADLPIVPWVLQTDLVSTNADAAQANPEDVTLNERCGRLLARTTVNQAEDTLAAFIAGETISFFSTATVYATEEGATDCSAESATRLAQPGELARAFGDLFIDPDAVQVALADFPPVIDGQFSATLTGQIDAAGTIVDLTLLIVAFRSENVTATVGSARSGSTPPADELQEFVELVLARIQANQ
jgi:hypothetical protein